MVVPVLRVVERHDFLVVHLHLHGHEGAVGRQNKVEQSEAVVRGAQVVAEFVGAAEQPHLAAVARGLARRRFVESRYGRRDRLRRQLRRLRQPLQRCQRGKHRAQGLGTGTDDARAQDVWDVARLEVAKLTGVAAELVVHLLKRTHGVFEVRRELHRAVAVRPLLHLEFEGLAQPRRHLVRPPHRLCLGDLVPQVHNGLVVAARCQPALVHGSCHRRLQRRAHFLAD